MAHETDLPTAGSIAFGLAVLVGIRAAAIAGEPDRQGETLGVSTDPAAGGARPRQARMVACNPIDRFIRARMDSEGMKPVAAADRRALIRRRLFRPDRAAADTRGGSGVSG